MSLSLYSFFSLYLCSLFVFELAIIISFQKMYGFGGLGQVKVGERRRDWRRRRRRRKKQDVGRYPMGPTTMSLKVTMNCVCNLNKTVEQTLKEF